MIEPTSWLPAASPISDDFTTLIGQFLPQSLAVALEAVPLAHAAQLLWQRQIRQPEQLAGFLDVCRYQPTDPIDSNSDSFGAEVIKAVARLQQAQTQNEKLVVWGEPDLAGVTTTALLWDGLSPWFSESQLIYRIPRRVTPVADLEVQLEALVAAGYSLLVGCCQSSLAQRAQAAGLEVIMLDRAWPKIRPPVTAWLNSRCLPDAHPLAQLPSVAVAYKLIEAIDRALGSAGRVTDLLDLVAVGLLADPVRLTGESRYLAQLGIACLQRNQDPIHPPRPGLANLLQLCRVTGDRPTDLSVGLGPRLQAICRLWDAPSCCVELLTSQDPDRSAQLAQQTELANARGKVLQRQVVTQANAKLAELDLSTTRVILLSDPQWPTEILALAAGQLAQDYGRPVILLSSPDNNAFAVGSARMSSLGRSEAGMTCDLCELLQPQASWLSEVWGEGAAADLNLPSQQIERFAEALNQHMRAIGLEVQPLQADLEVTVAELGKTLFQELRLLGPYGIGNPVPRLLIRNGWFTQVWHRKIRDLTGQKLDYIKTEFELWDDTVTQGFPGVWWGHYKDELPVGRCDLLLELDFSSYEDAKRQKRYELRLIAVRPAADRVDASLGIEILDQRGEKSIASTELTAEMLLVTSCPKSWQEVFGWVQQAQQSEQKLLLAYDLPDLSPPLSVWQSLVQQAISLSETAVAIPLSQLQDQLNLSEQTLKIGLAALQDLGFEVSQSRQQLRVIRASASSSDAPVSQIFVQAVSQEQFMQRYFHRVSLTTLQAEIRSRLQMIQNAS